MAIDPDKLMALSLPEVRQTYGQRDCILYALGVGQGIDPLDEGQLKYVDETKLVAIPTMANVLGHPGFWMRDMDTGIDWVRIVHGEQSCRLHRPLPVSATVVGRNRIVDIVDKGMDKGALLYVERTLTDAESGELLATLLQTVFCRGDGGFGGKSEGGRAMTPTPDRAPDRTLDMPTHTQLALIYRLSGDLNPLHSDPATARKAGFERPILHGLATFGIAGAALTRACCDDEPSRFIAISARFSAPVFPGDTISFDIWDTGPGQAAFRARVAERNAVVLSHGSFEYHGE